MALARRLRRWQGFQLKAIGAFLHAHGRLRRRRGAPLPCQAQEQRRFTPTIAAWSRRPKGESSAAAGEAIEQRGGQLGIAEDGGPFAEAQVGGDGGAGALMELARDGWKSSAPPEALNGR